MLSSVLYIAGVRMELKYGVVVPVLYTIEITLFFPDVFENDGSVI